MNKNSFFNSAVDGSVDGLSLAVHAVQGAQKVRGLSLSPNIKFYSIKRIYFIVKFVNFFAQSSLCGIKKNSVPPRICPLPVA